MPKRTPDSQAPAGATKAPSKAVKAPARAAKAPAKAPGKAAKAPAKAATARAAQDRPQIDASAGHAPAAVPGEARIVSWNVNGIRAAERNGLAGWLRAEIAAGAAFIGLQEVRARSEEIPPALAAPSGWSLEVVAAQKKGYSGVGFFAAGRPGRVSTSLGEPRFDDEGRFIEARVGEATLASVYFPNGNGTPLPGGKRSNDRIPYKLEFYRAVQERYAQALAAGEKIVVMGDFNTAHQDIDLARPKDNRETSGFTDIEREEVQRWLDAGWVDAWRHLHPDVTDVYSWWSQRFGIRARNVGWRIDMVMVSPAVLPHLRGAFIDTHVRGSDHCPVGIRVHRDGFFGGSADRGDARTAPRRKEAT
jgi:exodeoxyribonuclease-3